MKKIASLMIGIATLSILSACGNQEVQLPSNAPSLKTYSSEKYSFQYPEDYTITLPTKSFPVLAIEKAKNKRIEIFQMKDFGDRPWGFEGNESQEEIDGYVPKELLTSGTGENKYDVWLFYSKNDTATQKEEKEIFNSIVIPKSSIYTSAEFGFSFEIPEGFSLGEREDDTKCKPYFESYNQKHERELLGAAECANIVNTGEREVFEKEIKQEADKHPGEFVGPTESPAFHDTAMHIFEKPSADIVEYMDKHILDILDKKTYIEGHGKWNNQTISGYAVKTITQNRDIAVKTTVVDFEKYTMVIREHDESGKFTVTQAILKTLEAAS